MINFNEILIFSQTDAEKKAAELLSEEIRIRTGKAAKLCSEKQNANFVFETKSDVPRDGYEIDCTGSAVCVYASGIRGFIYGMGMFLRKLIPVCGVPALSEDISGIYSPDKQIRGHQIGYRTTPNTYDAWSVEDYRRYYLDMMFFGTNIVEHIPYEKGVSKRNRLMKYDEEEFLVDASKMADEFDLDVSLWHPNNDGETVEQAAERRGKLYETVPRLNVVFPPGGDPGEFNADEFVLRCKEISKALKRSHPQAQMWPSAQQPHSIPTWGETFLEEMNKQPEEIDGVITGPNAAFPLDVLRRRLPSKFPIRLYPDVTHNVRCEYPVHFDRDDWHFALATGLSRESTNPRPREYRLIHRLTRRYIVGSVSYSEGVNDDVNKMVWADMDYFPNCELRTSLLDYCRLFFYGANPEKLADGILALELNWQCDPAENPTIDTTLEIFETAEKEYPFLSENWRFLQLLMRAKCDYVVRHRRIFELELIKLAEKEINKGNLLAAKAILETDYDGNYKKERADIDYLAKRLFELIGMQLDVEHYCADSWERGAVLETIDLPVTDRKWLLGRLNAAENEQSPEAFMQEAINRNIVRSDEYYFSVAQNGLEECGVAQQSGMYMNFQGDRPSVNNGAMPTSMFKVYDNLSFRCKVGGLDFDGDYRLRITYLSKKIPQLSGHKITANGHVVYEGTQFGGEKDEAFDSAFVAPGFETATYVLPKEYIENGCVDLEFSEPVMGVMFCEFWITHD